MGVVPAEVLEDCEPCLVSCVEVAMGDLLDLEGGEEALGGSVVPAVPLAAHAAHEARTGERILLIAARVLAAAVGVVEQA